MRNRFFGAWIKQNSLSSPKKSIYHPQATVPLATTAESKFNPKNTQNLENSVNFSQKFTEIHTKFAKFKAQAEFKKPKFKQKQNSQISPQKPKFHKFKAVKNSSHV